MPTENEKGFAPLLYRFWRPSRVKSTGMILQSLRERNPLPLTAAAAAAAPRPSAGDRKRGEFFNRELRCHNLSRMPWPLIDTVRNNAYVRARVCVRAYAFMCRRKNKTFTNRGTINAVRPTGGRGYNRYRSDGPTEKRRKKNDAFERKKSTIVRSLQNFRILGIRKVQKLEHVSNWKTQIQLAQTCDRQ